MNLSSRSTATCWLRRSTSTCRTRPRSSTGCGMGSTRPTSSSSCRSPRRGVPAPAGDETRAGVQVRRTVGGDRVRGQLRPPERPAPAVQRRRVPRDSARRLTARALERPPKALPRGTRRRPPAGANPARLPQLGRSKGPRRWGSPASTWPSSGSSWWEFDAYADEYFTDDFGVKNAPRSSSWSPPSSHPRTPNPSRDFWSWRARSAWPSCTRWGSS